MARTVVRARALLATAPVQVLLVYAASRLYSSLLLASMLALASWAHWPFIGIRGKPGFFVFSGSWDGWFYRSIAERGYPSTLPLDSTGQVLPNEWAFLPVFPALERAVVAVTGLPTFAAGALVAAVAGAGAALVLERLLRDRIGRPRALRAVVLFCFGPLGFLLQVAYAESLFLLLAFATLLAMQRGRYLTALPCMVVAAFTRPGALALTAALVLQLALEWYSTRRRPRHLGRASITIVISALAGIAWSPIADLATGQPGGYLATELSWWTGWVGRPGFVPFTPWFLITSRWLGPVGVVAAAVLAFAFVFWILRRSPRRLGRTIGAFSVTYLVYLTAVFLPQFSLPRLLLPLAPLLGAGTFTASVARARRWLVVAAAGQPAAVAALWFLSYP